MKQKGFTLIELTVGLFVISIVTLVLSNAYKEYQGRVQANNLAKSLTPVVVATQRYIELNGAELQKTSPIIPNFADIFAPTLAELSAKGYLSNSYKQGGNLLSANVLVKVIKSPLGCIYPNCALDYLIYLDRAWLNDDGSANIKRVSQTADSIDFGIGGFSSIENSNFITSINGTWSVDNPIATAGILGIYGGKPIAVDSFGCSSFTTSTASIGSAINDCDLTVWGNTTIKKNLIGSGAEGDFGAITIKGSKNNLTGIGFTDENNLYQSTLIASRGQVGFYDETSNRWLIKTDDKGNTTLDQTNDGLSGFLNVGYAIEGDSCVTGQIAKASFTYKDGTNTQGKPLRCVNNIWSAVITGRTDYINAENNLLLSYPSTTLAMQATSGGVLNNTPYEEGGSLNVNDIFLRSTGRWLSQMGSGLSNWQGIELVANNTVINKPTCIAGGTPEAVILPFQVAVNDSRSISYTLDNNASSWTVRVRDGWGNDISLNVYVLEFCSF